MYPNNLQAQAPQQDQRHGPKNEVKLVPRRANLSQMQQGPRRFGYVADINPWTYCAILGGGGGGGGFPEIGGALLGVPLIVRESYYLGYYFRGPLFS